MARLPWLLMILIACKANPSKLDELPAKAAPRDAAVVQKDLATELEEIRGELGLPALAAAAWRDGKLIEIAAVGLRKADDPTSKVTTNDEWHLGSNTKAMTALLVGIYVDRGALHWDDTLGKLFAGDKLDPAYRAITLDQVLRHESGAPAEPPAELWKQLWADSEKLDDTVARARFVKATLAAPPAQAAGTFVYSNTNYMIAGAALEKVTGKRWQDLMKTELFGKLDMKSCGFGAPGSKAVVDQPRGHDAGGTSIEPGPAADNPPGLGPAGTVHCSLADYGKFLNLFATGEPAGLVTPETLQHLTTKAGSERMGYAGGWMVVINKRGKLLLHSGSNTMWYVTAMVAPGDHLAFVVATNKGDPAIEGSLEPLFGRYAEKPKKKAAMRVPLTSRSPEAIAEYEKARDLALHTRGLEAIEHLRKAIALDPTFARAYADLGSILPGAEGTEMLAKARPLAAKLPEAERLYVEAAQATRAGDDAKANAMLEKIVELAPGEWEVSLQLAYAASDRGDHDTAIARAREVLEARPDAAIAYNTIAYAFAAQKQWDLAIAAAKKQAELMPAEPNPLDSLGEIQLQAGRFADAEASFVAATKLDPSFQVAWGGAALARAYQGDYKGSYDAWNEEKKSTVPALSHEAMLDAAWTQFAEGKAQDALASLDALDKVADLERTPIYADVSIARGLILSEIGKYAEAAKASEETLRRADKLAGDAKPRVLRFARLTRLRAAALAGKPTAGADQLVSAIDDAAKGAPASTYLASVAAYAHGLDALARRDTKTAIEQMRACGDLPVQCRHDLAALQRKAGDAAGASATADAIRARPLRDAGVVYYWARAKR